MNLRSLSDINIHRGPALCAIFKFSAEPRVWPVGCNFAWCWCMRFWMMNFLSEYINERWWVYTWFHMARKDGPTVKLVPFQAIIIYGRRRFAQIIASNDFHFLFGFFVGARTSVFHFQFPCVQPRLWWCGFRFCKGEFPDHFWWKVMGRWHFGPLW